MKKKRADKRTGRAYRPTPMTVDEAIGCIFGRLCREHRERGADAEMEPQTLRRELGIPEEVFEQARKTLRGPADDQDLRLAYNVANRKWKLGTSWKQKCEEATRKARQPDTKRVSS